MSERKKGAAEAAQKLVEANGWKARQLVTDRIAEAIRLGDLSEAKEWELVGRFVDLALGKQVDPTTFEGARSARPPLRS